MHIHLIEGFPYIDSSLFSYIDREQHTLYAHDEEVDHTLIDALIAHGNVPIDRTLLSKYPQLTYIFRVGVGLDNFDLSACIEKGSKVVNRPASNTSAVADMTLWGLLSLLRKGIQAYGSMQQGRVPPRSNFTGNEVNKQHIGILGFGDIGQMIAKRLQGFGPQQVYFYDPYVDERLYGAEKVTHLEYIFQHADSIILALPLVESTAHIINETSLAQCKSHLKLINIGRGGLIDEGALYTFLKQYPHSGAYLDVWNDEPEHTDSIKQLLSLDNFLITPHIAAQSKESQQRMHYFEELA